MKITLWQRILCLVLTGAMLLGMAPAQAFAQGTEEVVQADTSAEETLPAEQETVEVSSPEETEPEPDRVEVTLPTLPEPEHVEITLPTLPGEELPAEEPEQVELLPEPAVEPEEVNLPEEPGQGKPVAYSSRMARSITTSGDFTYEVLGDGTC